MTILKVNHPVIAAAENEDGTMLLEIRVDEYAKNPRHEMDMFGHLICWHRRYWFSDKSECHGGKGAPRVSPDEFQHWWEEQDKRSIRLPVYLMDHSGLSMSTGSFGCPWDSGQVGWIYVTWEDIIREFAASVTEVAGKVVRPLRNTEKLRQRVLGVLESEIKLMEKYLRGEIYGFIATRLTKCPHCKNIVDEDSSDSCWGFYGMDDVLSSIPPAFAALAEEIKGAI